ncbi:hypothetical protein DFH09DRAFT_1091948 [Mycena vulgaris]|nr:hypothetical protein DFH09DRAFT_1091948 [Mycena vulgaris]
MALHPVASASSLSALRLVVHNLIDKFDFASSSTISMISPVPGLAQNNTVPIPTAAPTYCMLLHAFADYSPALLEPIIPGYNSIQVAHDFIVATFLVNYDNLFRVYLELNSFLVTDVQVRDAYVCRLTGYIHTSFTAPFTAQARALPYQQAAFQQTNRYEMDELEVVHAIPWNPGQVFHTVLRRLVGFHLPAPDTAEKMAVLVHAVHSDFTNFRIYFDEQDILVIAIEPWSPGIKTNAWMALKSSEPFLFAEMSITATRPRSHLNSGFNYIASSVMYSMRPAARKKYRMKLIERTKLVLIF